MCRACFVVERALYHRNRFFQRRFAMKVHLHLKEENAETFHTDDTMAVRKAMVVVQCRNIFLIYRPSERLVF